MPWVKHTRITEGGNEETTDVFVDHQGLSVPDAQKTTITQLGDWSDHEVEVTVDRNGRILD